MENTIAVKTGWTWRQWALCFVSAFLVYCGVQFCKLTTTPTTYEECVMKALSPGDSDTAAKIKAGVCRQQFPAPGEFDDIFGVRRK
jgi:hypothetical protein